MEKQNTINDQCSKVAQKNLVINSVENEDFHPLTSNER